MKFYDKFRLSVKRRLSELTFNIKYLYNFSNFVLGFISFWIFLFFYKLKHVLENSKNFISKFCYLKNCPKTTIYLISTTILLQVLINYIFLLLNFKRLRNKIVCYVYIIWCYYSVVFVSRRNYTFLKKFVFFGCPWTWTLPE